MRTSINYLWRVGATGFCFVSFGVGGLLLSTVIAPVVWLMPVNRQWKRDIIHLIIHLSSRVFVWMLRSLGVMTLSVNGGGTLKRLGGHFVVANHPSLIDVVLLNSLIKRTGCIVKEAVWYNPVMGGVARAAGYLSNVDPERLLAASAMVISSGHSLIVFPEGTRTTPGEPIQFQRGAANMALRAAKNITPVTITVQPATLTKDKTWYDVPPGGPFHITLTIGDDIAIGPFLQTSRWSAARSLTAALQTHFQHTMLGYE